MSQPQILVIGAGVSGLTTAYSLLTAGFRVTVVAEKSASETPSVIAGALWEWPPAVCGHHSDEISLKKSKAWAAESYQVFNRLSNNREAAVTMAPAVFYFKKEIEQCPFEHEKMEETQRHVIGFERGRHLIEKHGVNPNLGLVDAYEYLAPRIETDVYLAWLRNKLVQLNCQFAEYRVEGSLDPRVEELCESFNSDLIINCSGLGSIDLANDPMQPLRGALVKVMNDGTGMPPMLTAHCLANEDNNPQQQMIYIIPRGDKHLLLGGLAEMGEWTTDLNLNNYEPIQEMLERCRTFLPVLRSAVIDESQSVMVGLRPYRPQNVRLEQSPARVIHNYGHGGSGFTFSWGCATEVLRLVENELNSISTQVRHD